MQPVYSPPSRLVMKLTEGKENIKKRYANIRFTKFGPEQICEIFDPITDIVWGYVVVDKLIRGDTSIGGNRHKIDLTLEEVVNLAADMTLKNAVARLGVGGGKSGIRVNPDYFKIWEGETEESPSYIRRREEKRDLMEKFAEAIAFLKSYTIAPDMGTDGKDMQNIYSLFEKMFGKNHGRGGTGREGCLDIDGWGSTAYGLLQAAKAFEQHFDEFHIEGVRVSINGFGNVGGFSAKLFAEEGAKIIAVNDYHGVLYNENGLDIDELLMVRKNKDGVMEYKRDAVRYDARNSDGEEKRKILEELFKIPCDILIPAAVRNVIHIENYKDVDTKVILQGANGPVSAEIEEKLYREKEIISITDWIANSGGVIAAYLELEMDRSPAYSEIVRSSDGIGKKYVNKRIGDTVGENVRQILERMEVAKRHGKEVLFRDSAIELAEGYLTCPARIKDVRL